MKQYIYRPEEAGVAEWPSGELRLDGFEVTTNPEDADVFVCPGNLSLSVFKDDVGGLDRLPYMARFEDRHVFFDISDNFTKALGKRCMFIQCDKRSWMLKDDPNSISFPWPVEDYAECVDLPEGGFKYDVGAHMWTSTQTRIDSANACLNNPSLKCDIALYSDFSGYLKEGEPEYYRRRSEFRRSMRESRVSLCPESIPGVFPYRFFEAMSAGRVPVLVGSDFVFPFADEIDYFEFTVQIERADAREAGRMIQSFLKDTPDAELIRQGKAARSAWLNYLNREDWPRTMAYAVEKQLKEMGVPCR